jgi:hypothetical protein
LLEPVFQAKECNLPGARISLISNLLELSDELHQLGHVLVREDGVFSSLLIFGPVLQGVTDLLLTGSVSVVDVVVDACA